jgi:ATP-dependent helicase HrpB
VVFDEFHERSLDADLGLALARDAQQGLRPDLRLVVMSATLDAARIAALLGDAPVIQCEGRLYPIETRHRPGAPHGRLEQEMASAIRAAMAENSGSVLAFLPGAREIERTADLLRADVGADVDVRPLYGAMSPEAQDAAIAPAPLGRRKIVLATSIAETSLTIEDVRIVVDCGLTRRPRYDPGLGLSRLETVRASQAAIEQRRGRAGRTAPGVCWRLWHEGETRALPAFDRPEILEADLSGLVLDLAAWGVTDPASLTWLDAPPAPAWAKALELLARIGAVDADGRLSAHGKQIARAPLPPRLAHMAAVSAEHGEGELAALLAVLLSEAGLGGRDADVRARVARLLEDRSPRAGAARAMARRIAKNSGAGAEALDVERCGVVLARAYPDRVAKARGGGAFVMANGRAAALDASEAMAGSPFLVIAEIAGAADRARVLAAAPISARDVESEFAAEIEARVRVAFDRASGSIRGRRTRSLGKLVLAEGPIEELSASDLSGAWLEAVRLHGLEILDWSDRAQQLRARIALMREQEGEAWPELEDASLLGSLETWLAPAAEGKRRAADIDVAAALAGLIDHGQRRRLENAAPERFQTPAGGSAMIDYSAIGGPAVDVRLQELFGLQAHPSILGGRVALNLRLLSPAGRSVQTTRDLPGFWRGSYAAVRAEMRGRYPKHPWPEDPASAAPTRRAKPRGS